MNLKVMENKVLDEFIYKEKETFERDAFSSSSSESIDDSNKKVLRLDKEIKSDDHKPKQFT